MLRTSAAAFALVLASAACSSTPKLEDQVSQEQLNPVRLLPQHAPLYLRLTQEGWREVGGLVQGALDRPRYGHKPDLLSPELVLALEPVLGAEGGVPGLDPARPLFLAFGSVQAPQLERVVSLGGMVDEVDLPAGVHTTVLFPAADPGALTARLEAWWTESAEGLPVHHRLQAIPGWVRLDLFGGRESVEPAARQAALDQLLAHPAGPSLRLTPALADFVSRKGDFALYVPLERVRSAATIQSATAMVEAVTTVNPADRATIMAAGSTELAQQWMMLDASQAELEDLLLVLDLQPDRSLTAHSLTTLTKLGRKLAAEGSGPYALPRFVEGPAYLEVQLAGAYGKTARGVPLPRVLQLRPRSYGEDRRPMDETAELFAIAGPWGYLSVLQSPHSWVRALTMAQPEVNAVPHPVAMRLRLMPFAADDLLRRRQLPKAAMVLAFTTGAEADEFLFQLRRGASDLRGLTSVRLPSQEGQPALAFVGLGLSAEQALVPGGELAPVASGLSVTAAPELLELFGSRLDKDLGPLLSGPAELTAESHPTVGRARLHLGAPAPITEAAAGPVPAFEAIDRGSQPEVCRLEAASEMSRSIAVLAYVNPADRATILASGLEDFDAAVARCAQQDPSITADAQWVKERARKAAEEAANLQEGSLEQEPEGGGLGDAIEEPSEEPQAVEVPRFKIPVPRNAPSKGRADAKLTVLVFEDFQCPFCARLRPTLVELEKHYGKELRLVAVNLPLAFHHQARLAAQAALAAHKQNKFWQMREQLYASQRDLGRERLLELARELKLNLKRFAKDLDSKAIARQVEEELRFAQQFGAEGTPTLFINGRKVVGAQPLEALRTIADEELAAADALLQQGVKRKDLYAKLLERANRAPVAEAKPAEARPAEAKPAEPITRRVVPIRPEQPSRGPANAKVTLVMVTDFECPFCARAEKTLAEVEAQFGRDVRFVFANNPLGFHANAREAALAALAAHKQGKFWEMKALLFRDQRQLSPTLYEEHAAALGLDLERFHKDMVSTELAAHLAQDHKVYVEGLGASGTPTFFINGRTVIGAQPFSTFAEVIEEELATANHVQ